MSLATQRIVKSLVRTIAPNVLSVLVLILTHFGLQWTPTGEALLVTQQLLAYAIFAAIRYLEERGHKRAGYLLGWAGPPRYEQAPPVVDEGRPSGHERPVPKPPRPSKITYEDEPEGWRPSRPTAGGDRFARSWGTDGRRAVFRGGPVLAAVLALVASLIVVAAPAHAELYGLNVRWASTTIPVKVHVHDVSSRAVKQGVGYWRVTNLDPGIGGGSCMTAEGVADGCVDIGDGQHFDDPTWVAAAERFSLADGTIIGAWVRFSGDKNWGAGSSLRVLVDDIAAHEFGHGVGHAHTLDLTIPSEMQPSAKDWNGLQPFDVSEDLRLYPFPEPAAARSGKHSRAQLKVERFIVTTR